MEYSNKELQIFNGVLQLIKNGVNLRDITAMDIAKSAGIGKGTIYDYFKSKEEIIGNTIIYAVTNEHLRVENSVNQFSTFKEKLFALYDGIFSNIESNISIFTIMTAMDDNHDIKKFFHEDNFAKLKEFEGNITRIVHTIIIQGVKEDAIKPTGDELYNQMVMFGNISSVGKMAVAMNYGENTLIKEQLKENAYTILVKSMN